MFPDGQSNISQPVKIYIHQVLMDTWQRLEDFPSDKWQCNYTFVYCRFQDLFKTAHGILFLAPISLFLQVFP